MQPRAIAEWSGCRFHQSETRAEVRAVLGAFRRAIITKDEAGFLALFNTGPVVRTNKEIARTLEISPFTARADVAAVMQHFGATRRQDLPAFCNSASHVRTAVAGDTQLT